jgi:hypothetical protein
VIEFHSFVVTKMSSRDPSSGKSCLQRPAYLALVPVSFRAIEMSKSGFSASLVAVIVTAASGIKVPKPSAGIWPAPWLSGILVIRRSEDSIMVTPPSYFASGITAGFKN